MFKKLIITFSLCFIVLGEANSFWESSYPNNTVGYLREACIVAKRLENQEWEGSKENSFKLTTCYDILNGAMSYPKLLCAIKNEDSPIDDPKFSWLKALFTVSYDANPTEVMLEFMLAADKEPSRWSQPYTVILSEVFQHKFPCVR